MDGLFRFHQPSRDANDTRIGLAFSLTSAARREAAGGNCQYDGVKETLTVTTTAHEFIARPLSSTSVVRRRNRPSAITRIAIASSIREAGSHSHSPFLASSAPLRSVNLVRPFIQHLDADIKALRCPLALERRHGVARRASGQPDARQVRRRLDSGVGAPELLVDDLVVVGPYDHARDAAGSNRSIVVVCEAVGAAGRVNMHLRLACHELGDDSFRPCCSWRSRWCLPRRMSSAEPHSAT